MRNYLVLEELLDQSTNRLNLTLIHMAELICLLIIAFVISLLQRRGEVWIIFFCILPFWGISLIFFLRRREKMERSVALEAMGEYREAMNIASPYAKPSLLARFYDSYKSEIDKSTPSIVNSNQILQPTGVAQINSTNHNSTNPTIHIHNTQTQQGSDQNYIQDSVVTDWNQR